MTHWTHVLSNVSLVEFVLLAALTTLQWVRHRIRGAGWVALSFAILAGLAILAEVLVLAEGLHPRDGPGRQPGRGHRSRELLRGLLDRLVPAAGLHDQLRAVTVRPDAGGNAGAHGDRIGKLDDLLARQHPVTLGLQANAPFHRILLTHLR